jgi:hypothetical protein
MRLKLWLRQIGTLESITLSKINIHLKRYLLNPLNLHPNLKSQFAASNQQTRYQIPLTKFILPFAQKQHKKKSGDTPILRISANPCPLTPNAKLSNSNS